MKNIKSKLIRLLALSLGVFTFTACYGSPEPLDGWAPEREDYEVYEVKTNDEPGTEQTRGESESSEGQQA